MDVQIKTKDVRLTESLEEYIGKRLRKLDRIDERIVDAKFELRPEQNRSGGKLMVAQFTIATKKAILRTEEKNHDIHTAIDFAVDRMATQIRRFHDKKIDSRRRKSQRLAAQQEQMAEPILELDVPVPDDEQYEPLPATNGEESLDEMVRRKRFQILAMGEEEAIEQMELLGHDFFVFFNPDDDQLNVLYRRRDGQYGVIQPELA